MIGEEVIAYYGDAGDGEELFEKSKLVRCKECTFAKPTETENVIQCTWLSGYTFRKDHYCSAGERIDNE